MIKTKKIVLAAALFLLAFLLADCSAILGSNPLAGTSWKLVLINDKPVLGETEPTIKFSDGKISGSSGCNSFGGSYKVSGQKLTTTSIAMTLMACADPAVMEQEQEFLEHLQNAKTFKLNENQLQLFISEVKNLTLNRIP
jgi:heat shock protein HslJ